MQPELKYRGLQRILKMGLAFSGKKVYVLTELVTTETSITSYSN